MSKRISNIVRVACAILAALLFVGALCVSSGIFAYADPENAQQQDPDQSAQAANNTQSDQNTQDSQTTQSDQGNQGTADGQSNQEQSNQAARDLLSGGNSQGISVDVTVTQVDSSDEGGSGPVTPNSDQRNAVHMNQLPDSSFLYDASISDLASADSYFDGQMVQVRGEAVGDLIRVEGTLDKYWLTIQDDNDYSPSVVVVQITEEQAARIDTLGNYKQKGSTVQVTGYFHLACKEHEGLSDIHAQEATVLEKGEPIIHEVNSVIFSAGVLALLCGIGLWIFYRYLCERTL